VTAFKWQWAFSYRDEGVRIEGVEGEYPTLTVPTETTVRFTLRSNDEFQRWLAQQKAASS
jgi:heme/copper-type cytochrome/quinol oxidase subunit 2